MIRWTRAPETGRIYTCGLCGRTLERGAAMKVITIDRVAHASIRCECDGPAPPDLPSRAELTAPPAPAFVPVRALLPLDWSTTRPRGRDE
jgi:hypothetical protein